MTGIADAVRVRSFLFSVTVITSLATTVGRGVVVPGKSLYWGTVVGDELGR